MIRFHPRCVALLSVAPVLVVSVRVKADDSLAPPWLPAIAATVNGAVIPTLEWLTRMQAVGFNDFNQNLRTRHLNAGQIALEQLMNERLILQYVAKIGFGPSEAELSEHLSYLLFLKRLDEQEEDSERATKGHDGARGFEGSRHPLR
jgi:hypothetical protein